MPKRADFDIVGSFNQERLLPLDCEQTINCYEFVDPLAKKPKALLPTSGLQLLHDTGLTNGGGRGSIVFRTPNDATFCYVVIKDTVYEIDEIFAFNVIGTIGTNDGYVGIDANTFQVIIVDGQDGWILDTSMIPTTFTQITAPGFPTNPIDVCALDGFFIVPFGGTNEFGISALNDGTMWDALDFALVTTHPGTITACKTLHRRLFLFCQNFTEVWENAGLSDFPFRRNNSLLMEVGTIAIASVRSGFDRMFFLSNDKDGLGSVMEVVGSQANPVSTQALDYQLQKYATTTDAVGILLKDNGIIFYRLNFTDADVTWVYNATMSNAQHQMWHQEQMLDKSRHIAQIHFYFQEKNFFISYLDGKVYNVDDVFNTNAGEAIQRIRVTNQIIDESYAKIRIDRLEVDAFDGQGTPNGNDVDPFILMFASKDGGQTWGTGRSESVGKMGEFNRRTIWRKLGTSRNWVFRFEFYNMVKFAIFGAAIIAETLPE